MSGTQLNTDGQSTKRLKFQKLSDRLEKISVAVDVKHLSSTTGGSNSSTIISDAPHLQVELEQRRELDTTTEFKRFYYKLWPLVQSLAEILFHLPTIVDQLSNSISKASDDSLPSMLLLVSMLAKDVNTDLRPYFAQLMQALIGRIQSVSKTSTTEAYIPEIVGKIIECMSYLIKYQLALLAEHPEVMLQFYGPLLGHHVSFVRDFAAKSFSVLIKALKLSVLRKHVKKLYQAVSTVLNDFLKKNEVNLDSIHALCTTNEEWPNSVLFNTRIADLLDGVSLLMFYSTKGVNGTLHSKAVTKLELLYNLGQVANPENSQLWLDAGEVHEEAITSCTASAAVSFISGFVLQDCVAKLMDHLNKQAAAGLWEWIVASTSSLVTYVSLLQMISEDVVDLKLSVLLACEATVEILLNATAKHFRRKLPDAQTTLASHFMRHALNSISAAFVDAAAVDPSCVHLLTRLQHLFCRIWSLYPTHSILLLNIPTVLPLLLRQVEPEPAVIYLCNSLFDTLPANVIRTHLLEHVVANIRYLTTVADTEVWLPVLLRSLRVYDVRRPIHESQLSPPESMDAAGEVLSMCEEDLMSIAASAGDCLASYLSSSSTCTEEAAYMACLALVWTTKVFPAQMLDYALSSGTHDRLLASLLKRELKDQSPTIYAVALHYYCLVASLDSPEGIDDGLKALLESVTDMVTTAANSIALTWAYRSLLELVSIRLGDATEWPLIQVLSEDKHNSLHASLSAALNTGSHWLRANLLTILSYFPPPQLLPKDDSSKPTEYDESFDLVSVLLECSIMEITFESAREFSRKIGSIEVLLRGNRLPEQFANLAVSACLGLMYAKLQPYWQPLTDAAIAGLSSGRSEESMWQLLLTSIHKAGGEYDEVEGEVAVPDDDLHAFIREMRRCDDGSSRLCGNVVDSTVFFCAATAVVSESTVVEPDARADADTVFRNYWGILKKCPAITLRRSKLVVPMFLSFVRDQYYAAFTEDPEVVDLLHTEVLLIAPPSALDASQGALYSHSRRKSLKIRLEVFLTVFAEVTSPRQLFQHAILFDLFLALISKSDAKISKLALDCLFTFKPQPLVSLKASIYRLIDDKTMRDELLNLDLSADSELVASETIPQVAAFVSLLLYSKFSARAGGSKSAREQGIARRNAVLVFLSRFDSSHLPAFLHLILRGIVPGEFSNRLTVNHSSKTPSLHMQFMNTAWWMTFRSAVACMEAKDIASVAAERHIAFLHFVEHMCRILGHRLDAYVDVFIRMLLLALAKYRSYQAAQDAVDEEPADGSDAASECQHETHDLETKNQFAKVRTLCLLRLTDFVEMYAGVYDFESVGELMMEPLGSLIEALPSAVASSKKSPALLTLLKTMTMNDSTVTLISSRASCVMAIIASLSAQVDAITSRDISDILLRLLSIGEGRILHPHVDLLISSFCKRFFGGSNNKQGELQSYNLSEVQINMNGSIKIELNLLFKFSDMLFTNTAIAVSDKSILDIATLLLGMLRTYIVNRKIRIEEELVLNILNIYQAVIPRLNDVQQHIPFISRLFGPTSHKFSPLNIVSIRKKIVDIYSDLSLHRSVPRVVCASAEALKLMTAMDYKLIGARDFSSCIPLLQGLAGGNTGANWSAFLGPPACSSSREASLCHAPVHECLRSMYDDELLVRGASLAALKVLVTEAAKWSGAETESTIEDIRWFDVVVTVVLPALHQALKEGSDSVMKGFIGLLAHAIRHLSQSHALISALPQLHCDMSCLAHTDPEQDFFENIVHIQLHRRMKALTKVRAILKESCCPFVGSTLTNVLLPIGYHLLTSEEFSKKDSQALVMEAAHFIGAISFHLPWSQYLSVIKYLLKRLDHSAVDRERFLLNALCFVLDSFHFDLTVTVLEISSDASDVVEDDSKTKIAECIVNTILPWVKVFLLKEEKDKNNLKTHTVRPLVAVALAKLINRLEAPLVSESRRKGMLENLILSIVNVLKSRDSGARDAARDSLSRIVTSLGLNMLYPVLRELDNSLNEGYQRHVRNYTIRSLLFDVLESYTAPTDHRVLKLDENLSSVEILAPDFDKCIPLIVSSALDDLVGNTQQDRETDGAVRTLIREAKGSKSNEILEITARNLLFRPSYALLSPQQPGLVSSIHALVSPLLNKLDGDADNIVIGRVGEALQRVSLGLSKNASIVGSEILLYIYSTIHPLLIAVQGSLTSKDCVPSYLLGDSDDEEHFGEVGTSKSKSWLPNEAARSYDRKSAVEERDREKKALHAVQDGFSAPKLTGHNRHKRGREASDGKAVTATPGTVAVIKFCLGLLYFILKQQRLDSNDPEIVAMLQPFIDILISCLKFQGVSDVVTASVRCVSMLLGWEGLSIGHNYRKILGKQMFSTMFRGGALISSDSELVQACLKGLSCLFKLCRSTDEAELPLSLAGTRSMLQMLIGAVMETSAAYQNSAYQLIRVIVDLKLIVPEVYDIVTKLCDQIALSHRKNIRDSASSIVSTFIINYPLGDKKVAGILKKLITNCSYEFDDGRRACIEAVCLTVRVLPQPVLEDHCSLVFLPLTLRLVNETSTKCRESAYEVLTTILRRVTLDVANTFVDYALQWLRQASVNLDSLELQDVAALIRTGAQVVSVIASGRSECLKKSTVAKSVLSLLTGFLPKLVNLEQTYNSAMEEEEESGDKGLLDEWVVTYYVFQAIEHMYIQIPHHTDSTLCLQGVSHSVQEGLLYPHSWVRASTCRILLTFVRKREEEGFDKTCAWLDHKALFEIARRLCVVLNQNVISSSLLEPVCAVLIILMKALHDRNDSCPIELSGDDVDVDVEGGDETLAVANGSFWIIRRLCGIASDGKGARRASVLKVFTAVVTETSEGFVRSYLKYILEIVIKTTISKAQLVYEDDKATYIVAFELQEAIEKKVGSMYFTSAFLEIQQRVSAFKIESKQQRAVSAVTDQREFAVRKMENSKRKKDSSRRNAEHTRRGGPSARKKLRVH